MHHTGHIGTALAVYAPAAYLLVSTEQVALAAVGLIGMLVIEPLPDRDMELPVLTHRGGSHTLLCAVVVGLCAGSVVYVGGRRIRNFLVGLLAEFSHAGVPVLSRAGMALAAADVWALAVFAFAVAVLAIISHLLADVLTPMGIRPFWPVSRRKLSLGLWTASNWIANPALLVFGIATLASAAGIAVAPSIESVAIVS